ncbi:MAG: hypothetical protein ABIH23_22535 [bacterium]
METKVTLTTRGKQQEACPQLGISGEIYISTLNWPSLGITPDAPEWGIRTLGGPLAFSRDRDALERWAERNHVDVHNEDDSQEIEEERE